MRLEKEKYSDDFKQAFFPQPRAKSKMINVDSTALANILTMHMGNLDEAPRAFITAILQGKCDIDLREKLFPKGSLASESVLAGQSCFLWNACFPGIQQLIEIRQSRKQLLHFLHFGMYRVLMVFSHL